MESWKKSIDDIPTLDLLHKKRSDIAYCIQSSKVENLPRYRDQLDYIDEKIRVKKEIFMLLTQQKPVERPPTDDEQKEPHLFV